ncbi:hypothetical protein TgHK011_009173 [Trichoderma gracile]|nr:hypothetical protein TgHK011_009173 [Trichoderma gracile]
MRQRQGRVEPAWVKQARQAGAARAFQAVFDRGPHSDHCSKAAASVGERLNSWLAAGGPAALCWSISAGRDGFGRPAANDMPS